MIKYDLFAADTNNKFSDYEFALSELEKNIQPVTESSEQNITTNELEPVTTSINDIEGENVIMSSDLKSIIKQELANA